MFERIDSDEAQIVEVQDKHVDLQHEQIPIMGPKTQ